PGGRAYVYFIYGMYYCFNISANRPGEPEGVLIRALKPLEGVEIMKRRYLAFQRGKAAPEKAAPPREDALCSGPGKLCRAMGIDKSHYGRDLTAAYGLRVEQSPDGAVDGGRIVTAPRINIDYAGEAKDWLWRFVYINND
ncbi:MAG: DNA-3-methyladenine glycosylase, partial [Clostridiales bacterium]|nr:DNA-3-methyladenine glycosylase [Clostridiales bacterium]